jgi:hypothetical protein
MDTECCLFGHNDAGPKTPSQCSNRTVEDLGEGWKKPSNPVTSEIPLVDANVPYPPLAEVQVDIIFGLNCGIVVENVLVLSLLQMSTIPKPWRVANM